MVAITILIGTVAAVVNPNHSAINQARRVELTCSVCPAFVPILMWNFTQRESHESDTIAKSSQSLSSEYSLLFGYRSQTLVINNAQWRNVGIYKCIVAINGTITEAEARLDVLSESLQCNSSY